MYLHGVQHFCIVIYKYMYMYMYIHVHAHAYMYMHMHTCTQNIIPDDVDDCFDTEEVCLFFDRFL